MPDTSRALHAPSAAPTGQTPPTKVSITLGLLLGAIILLKLLNGFGVLPPVTSGLADAASILVLALLAPQVRGWRHLFLAISTVIVVYCLIARDDPAHILKPAFDQASFIIAFFCALASLQHVAARSQAISRAAAFLANQPSGRRYLALSCGAQVFALMLNYGALSLLGTMARRSAERESEPAVRALRIRRMLQGAQCGFAASLTWSPLAFATVITSTLIPGVTVGQVIAHGLGSAAILVLTGWLVDRPLKNSLPRGTVVAPPDPVAAHDVRSLWPLLWLLLGVAIPAALLDFGAHVAPSRAVLAKREMDEVRAAMVINTKNATPTTMPVSPIVLNRAGNTVKIKVSSPISFPAASKISTPLCCATYIAGIISNPASTGGTPIPVLTATSSGVRPRNRPRPSTVPRGTPTTTPRAVATSDTRSVSHKTPRSSAPN